MNPVRLTRIKIAVRLWKKYRNFQRCMEVLGLDYTATKKNLSAFEPEIFLKYPPRGSGRPAELRTALSKSEIKMAKRLYGVIPLASIADILNVWSTRLEYFLWKEGVHRPGESATTAPPLKGDAPHTWPKSWQREYIMTEMKRKNRQFEQVIDDVLPKKETHTFDEEDEIMDLLREYGIE